MPNNPMVSAARSCSSAQTVGAASTTREILKPLGNVRNRMIKIAGLASCPSVVCSLARC